MPKLVVNLHFLQRTCISKKNLLKYTCKKERKNMSKQIIYHGSYCEVKEVLESWIIEKIDNYNSSMYYESPE